MGDQLPWRAKPNGGIELRVRLTPKSSQDRVEGIEPTADGPAVKARVRAVPEDGEANAALEALVAEWLGVPRQSVEVTGGGKSRVKVLTVAGDGVALAEAARTALVQSTAATSSRKKA